MTKNYLTAPNGTAHLLEMIPVLDFDSFRHEILSTVTGNTKLACLTSDARHRAIAVLADVSSRTFRIYQSIFPKTYPSMTHECPQVHLFEREIDEQWGIFPRGHPWFKPVRFHTQWNSKTNSSPWPLRGPGIQNYYKVEGEQIHEVAVGPVHAGVIEPGHFRFQCNGENVYHLEIALGYQHRGIERALENAPAPLSLKMVETAAGDTSIGHGLAYLTALEALMGIQPPERALIIRAMALELERLANHTGDLGALAGDVGFQPSSAYCGRLRGDFLNLTAEICGSRLGRDLLVPGGTRFDVDQAQAQHMLKRLAAIESDLMEAIELLWNTSSVRSRFDGTGIVTKANAIDLGILGPAARASGIDMDARRDFPMVPYDVIPIPIALEESGDIYARARIRASEIAASIRFVRSALEALQKLEPSPIKADYPKTSRLAPSSIAIGAIEGWRGMVFHMAITDKNGQFERYKIVDPSFFNWQTLAIAMRGEGISDFPLCNKSFNLSYCGFDL